MLAKAGPANRIPAPEYLPGFPGDSPAFCSPNPLLKRTSTYPDFPKAFFGKAKVANEMHKAK